LKELGREHNPNVIKDFITRMGAAATDILHVTKNQGDKATRNLLQAYSVENLEVAVYESLHAAASEAGDSATASLAKEIQKEEEAAAKKVFARIDPLARRALLAGNKA